MGNQPHAFKHRDIIRVVKAARAAGVDVKAVAVDPHSGVITVGPVQAASSTGTINAEDAKRLRGQSRSLE